MSYVLGLKCKECGHRAPVKPLHVCEQCFGPYEVEYDYAKMKGKVTRESIQKGPKSLWRYRDFLPVDKPVTGFHSGFTPLKRADRLAKELGCKQLWIKDDSCNYPTYSYKERVVSVSISKAVEFGFDTVGCASTGNLANSTAAHAAQAGIRCFVMIPHDLEQGKVLGSLIFGPTMVRIRGTYDDVNRLCTEIADKYGWAIVNVNLRPYYTEGAKTYGFEIVEQLGWTLPQHTVVPTAGGTILPKIYKAYRELIEIGLVEDTKPKIYSAQAAGCNPVVTAIKKGVDIIEPQKPNTIAKSIAIGNPADGYYAANVVRESGGWGESATDREIVDAIKLLAKLEGIWTEPAGGTTLAAAIKLIEQGRIPRDESIVVSITGNGLKTQEVVQNELIQPRVIEAKLTEFDALLAENEASALKTGKATGSMAAVYSDDREINVNGQWIIAGAAVVIVAAIGLTVWLSIRRVRLYTAALRRLNLLNAGGMQEYLVAVCPFLGVERCAVAKLDREEGLRVVARSGDVFPLGNDFDLKQLPLCSQVLSSRQPAFVENAERSKVLNKDVTRAAGIRGLALMPLIAQDSRLGLLILSDTNPRKFSSTDRRVCQVVADKIAGLLAGGDSYAAMTVALREQQATYEKREAIFAVNASVYRAVTLNEAVQMIVDLAPGVLGVDLCLLSFDNDDGQTMRIAAITKPRAANLVGVNFSRRGNNGELVRNTRRTLIVENAREHPKVNHAIREQLDIGSIAYLPLLRAGGAFMGILSIVRHRPGSFSQEQLNLAEQFAARAAGAIENADLLEQTRRDAQTKTMLLRELNHRVKNNLASIITLLSLDEPEMSPRAHQWLGRAIDRIRTMARTHDLFAGGMDRVTLVDLVGQTISSLSVARPVGISVTEEIQAPVTLRTDRAVSLAMVLHELCYNAIVHGLGGSRGTVLIRARMSSNDPTGKSPERRVVLEVIDDATASTSTTPPESERIGGGVGLTLVKGLVTRELHGEFNLQRGKERTIATVSFPVGGEDLSQAA